MQKEIVEIGKKSPLIFLGDIAQKVIESVAALIIGRLLGADVYGQFVFASSILFFLSILPKLGFNNGIINYLSRDDISENIKKSVLTFSLIISFVISVVFVIIIFINLGIFQHIVIGDETYYQVFNFMLPSLVILVIREILQSYFLGKKRVKEILVINNFFIPTFRILSIIILYYVFNINNFVSLIIPYYINAIISIIVFTIIIIKENGLGNLRDKTFNRVAYMQYTLPLLVIGMINIIAENTDRYMLGILVGSDSVGVYRIAYMFGAISSFGLAAINRIFQPIISQMYYSHKQDELNKVYRFAAKWSFILSAVVLGVITINAREIMLLPGSEFASGAGPLIIIAIGQFVNAAVGSVGLLNMMSGNSKAPLVAVICSTAVNVALNVLLIPHYAMIGAAVATAIALIINNIINFVYMYKKFKFNPFSKYYLTIIISMLLFSFGTVLLFNLFHLHYLIKLVLSTLFFVGTFCLSIYLFVFKDEEKEMFNHLINRVRN